MYARDCRVFKRFPRWLRKNVPRWLPITLSTPIATIIDIVAMRVQETVNYEATRKFKVHIVEGVMEQQVAQFAFIDFSSLSRVCIVKGR